MAPRLSRQTSIFGEMFFVTMFLLGTEGQKKLKKKKSQFSPFVTKVETDALTLKCSLPWQPVPALVQSQ